MNDEKEYVSKEKLKELNEELEHLTSVRRKEIADALEFAKSLGDLSENAEYQEAREAQASTEERIAKIESILKSAVVVSKRHSKDIASVGSIVVLQKKGTQNKFEYQLVGSEEADIENRKISNKSPLGEAVFGKKKGDQITCVTPGGEIAYVIVDLK